MAALLLISACDQPDPARDNVIACHRQLMKSEPHQPGDIIEVMEHSPIPACMAARGFIFMGDVAECSQRVIDVDNPACYRQVGRP
ncbi:MAG: hypothetical protein V4601_03525 [Pseudomonadota bacterium]